MEIPTETSTILGRSGEPPTTRLGRALLVMSAEVYASIPLPSEGAIVIGRAVECEVQLEDPKASRRHARLHLGPTLLIEDLGGPNGTRLRGERISPNVPVSVSPGEAIEIGSAILLVQATREGDGAKRSWSHTRFEAVLGQQCQQRSETHFALVRIHLDRAVSWARVIPLLARDLPSPHLFAAYGPNELELLLQVESPDEATRLIETVQSSLNRIDVPIRFGVAWYPRDGRTPDALVARANALLRPAEVTPPADGSVPEFYSAPMRAAYELAARAAPTDINVLLLGKTGVGKDVLARAIHQLSQRRNKPMVSLNCAGVPEALIESELFGHERGAFTGAHQSKRGLLETADGGTVFLDEIGEMPLSIQAKLLRVIEKHEVQPLGSTTTRPLNCRFIAATNRNLEAEVVRGAFRSDLLFRLNTFTVPIPLLAERQSEIVPLARTFVAEMARSLGRPRVPELSAAALTLLERYDWPGNVRELRNAIERAVVLCSGDEIGLEHFETEKLRGRLRTPLPADGGREDMDDEGRPLTAGQLAEKRRMVEALAACAGNQTRAAKRIGMPRRTFVAKRKRYNIPGPLKDDEEDGEGER